MILLAPFGQRDCLLPGALKILTGAIHFLLRLVGLPLPFPVQEPQPFHKDKSFQVRSFPLSGLRASASSTSAPIS